MSRPFRHGESGFSARRDGASGTGRTSETGDAPRAARGERTDVDVTPTAGLAERQAELLAAVVAGAPDPPGFDPARLAAARRALLRKRAGEAAKHWPALAASLGPRWSTTFAAHHAGRPPGGGLRDGWDLARALRPQLTSNAAAELREREARWRYDGVGPPRRRLLNRVRRALTGG